MEKTKKNNTIRIVEILVIIILLAGLIYLLAVKKEKDTNISKDNNINVNETKSEIVEEKGLVLEDTTKYTNELIEYYDTQEKEFCYYDDISKCSSKKISIKTETNNVTKYNEYKDKYVFYKDNNKVKVYNNYTQKSYVIKDIGTNYFSYSFYTDDLTDDFIGIIYYETDESYATYYSIIEGKIIYDKDYKDMNFLSKDYVTGSEFECSKNICTQNKTNLLSTKENKILMSYKYKKDPNGYYENNIYYQLLRNEKETYICLSTFIDATIYLEIYNTDFKKLQEDIGEFSASISKDGYLYIEKNGIVTAYDNNGKVVKKSEKYNVLQIIDDYIVTIKNDKLVLITVDNKITEIASWNKNKNEYMIYYSKSLVVDNKHQVLLAVIDSDVTVDDVWNECTKKKSCNVNNKEELEYYYDLGYMYYYTIERKEIKKVPIYM